MPSSSTGPEQRERGLRNSQQETPFLLGAIDALLRSTC